MTTVPRVIWYFVALLTLFLQLYFHSDLPSPNSQESCVVQGQRQNLFVSFPSAVWMMETDVKDKGYLGAMKLPDLSHACALVGCEAKACRVCETSSSFIVQVSLTIFADDFNRLRNFCLRA